MVGEATLHLVQLDVEPSTEVAGVEQREPQAGDPGRLDERSTHGIRIGVGDTTRRVVQIMELADGGIPAQHHFREGRSGQREIGIGVELRRYGVHLLPPRPERSRSAVGATAERPMERMGVAVGETGQHHPASDFGARGRRVGRGNVGEHAVIDREEHARRQRVAAQPCPLAPQLHSVLTIPRARRIWRSAR